MSGTGAGCISSSFQALRTTCLGVHLLCGAHRELYPGREVRCRDELKTEGMVSTRKAGRIHMPCYRQG